MPRFHYVSLVVLFLFLFSTPSITVANEQVLPCTEQNVKDWILARNALVQRFETIDRDLSMSLLTNYGLIPNVMPRVDKLVELQEVRREFEGLPYPECGYDFFWATLVYWNRRIDYWTYSMHIKRATIVSLRRKTFIVILSFQHCTKWKHDRMWIIS